MRLLRCTSIFVRMRVTEAESMATAASRSPQYVRGGLHALYNFAHSTSTHEEGPELFYWLTLEV